MKPETIKAVVTFVFSDKTSMRIGTDSIKESAHAYHIGNLIFPFKFIYDATLQDPDNVLGLTGQ